MRTEVMEFYSLTRSPRAVGFYETAHHRQLLQDIKQAVYDGDLVALCCGFRRSRPGIPSVFRAPFQSDAAHQSNLMAPRVGVVS